MFGFLTVSMVFLYDFVKQFLECGVGVMRTSIQADTGVFDRLCRACSHIETVCKFSHDDHLGYITSCPTNLGTALRASVHIKLPKLMKNKKIFNEIADKYFVQIRGIHGEHTETNDGVFDISNRRRLGRSEKELV
jgi:creatine kinase/arginine kinase